MNIFFPGDSWPRRLVHAGFWAFTLEAVRHFFLLGRTVILAILLWPEDFGLFGISILTVVALETFSRTGFQQALIHKKGEIGDYLDIAWTVQVIRGTLLTFAVWVAAPLAAAFFAEPRVVPLLRLLGFSLFFQGLTNIGVVSFQKDLEFHREFAFHLGGILVDMVVAVAAAYLFRNAWALVLGFVAGDITRLVMSYLIHPYRPRFRLEKGKFRELFDFGMWMLFVGITVFIGNHGSGVVVGKIIGVTALGLYQMAYRIPQLAINRLCQAISQVAFPAYARLQGSPERIREAYMRIAGLSMALSIPAAVGMVVVGHDFTRIFFGEKWIPMIPALVLLSFAALISSVAQTGRPAFMGVGRPQVVFQMQGVRAAIVFLAIYPLARRFGIIGAALTIILSGTAALVVWYMNIRRQLTVTSRDLGNIIAPPLLSSLIMAAAFFCLRYLTKPLIAGRPFPELIWFVIMIIIGAAVYFAAIIFLCRIFPDHNPFRGLIEAVRG